MGLTDALSRYDRALQERDGDGCRSEARETGRVCTGDLREREKKVPVSGRLDQKKDPEKKKTTKGRTCTSNSSSSPCAFENFCGFGTLPSNLTHPAAAVALLLLLLNRLFFIAVRVTYLPGSVHPCGSCLESGVFVAGADEARASSRKGEGETGTGCLGTNTIGTIQRSLSFKSPARPSVTLR